MDSEIAIAATEAPGSETPAKACDRWVQKNDTPAVERSVANLDWFDFMAMLSESRIVDTALIR